MLKQRDYNQHRAFCGALRTMRSALAALVIAWMQTIIDFVQHKTMTREEVNGLLRTLSVATLMIIFNFVQRFREKELPPSRRRRLTASARRRGGREPAKLKAARWPSNVATAHRSKRSGCFFLLDLPPTIHLLA